MQDPAGPPEDADAAYPETEGYHEFVEKHKGALERLYSLRSDAATEKCMRENIALLEGSGHTQRWFMLRACENPALLKAGTADEELLQSSRQLFLLDAACDAANHHFHTKFGASHATSVSDIQESALQGVERLFRALQIPGDPLQLKKKLEEKVSGHIFLLKKRLVKKRVQAEKETRRKAQQKKAEAEALRETEARKKRQTQCKSAAVVVTLLVLMAAWAQSLGAQ